MAFWYMFSSISGLAMLAYWLIQLAQAAPSSPMGAIVVGWGGWVVAIAGVFYALIGVLGLGLWKYHGWARWIVVGLLSLHGVGSVFAVANPIVFVANLLPLAWTAALLWALLCEKANTIFTPEYRLAVRRTRRTSVSFATSPFFFIPAALGAVLLLIWAYQIVQTF